MRMMPELERVGEVSFLSVLHTNRFSEILELLP